ncbi:hypothetical protein VZO05_12840 [Aggregatilineales bacterium SYSU G02658]
MNVEPISLLEALLLLLSGLGQPFGFLGILLSFLFGLFLGFSGTFSA